MKRIVIAFLLIILCAFTLDSDFLCANTLDAPEDVKEICEKYGEQYGICPELLMAIAETESSYNADAVNGDCKGIMQISEKWHKDRMQKLGVTDIWDADGNILVATDYLYELFTEYEDVAAVLMAYNGDSRLGAYLNGNCEMSVYAEVVLERSYELERLHGK